MEKDLYLKGSAINYDHDLWKDMVALCFHYNGSNIHEENIRIQHRKGNLFMIMFISASQFVYEIVSDPFQFM